MNGKVLTELPILIDPATDKVDVDGEPIRLGRPKGETPILFPAQQAQGRLLDQRRPGRAAPGDRPAPARPRRRLYPVGRLDAESKGLLLLTNDGELTNRLTHPRYGVPKTLSRVVDGYVTPECGSPNWRRACGCPTKRGQASRPAAATSASSTRSRDESILEITIREGRNREVRRMLARLGHKVRDLMRIKIGPLELHGLAPGQFRPLTPREVKDLRRSTEPPTSHKPARGQRPGRPRRSAGEGQSDSGE